MAVDTFCGSPLWNLSLTWSSQQNTWPQFTDCFQKTVLVWVPCGWFFVSLPFYLYYLVTTRTKSRNITFFSILKTFLCFMLAAFVLCDVLVSVYYEDIPLRGADYVAAISQILAYLCCMVVIQLERWNGIITSGVLFLFWLLSLFTHTILCYNKVMLKQYEDDIFHFNIFVACYSFVFLEVLFHCFAEIPPIILDKKQSQKKPNQELLASFPSRMTIHWITPLITKAFRTTLCEEDLGEIHPRDDIKLNLDKFLSAFNKEKEKCCQQSLEVQVSEECSRYKVLSKRPISLRKVLMSVYFKELCYSWCFKVIADVLTFTAPVILNLLIMYAEKGEPPWKSYVLAVLLFILVSIHSFFNHSSFYVSMLLAMRIRGVLTSAVFRKMLSLNNAVRQTMSVGQIVNTMSIDCSRLQDAVPFLYVMLSAPIQISFSLYLLYQQLGPSVFAGLVLLLLFVPINGVLMGKIKMYQGQQMKNKDTRIKLMNEILNGIKVIKLYAWEESLLKKIGEIRAKEIKILRKAAFITSISTFLSAITPFLVTFVTFAAYTLSSSSHHLNAQKAFVSLSLFNILRAPVELVPLFMSQSMQLTVAVNRLTKYFNSPDISSGYIKHVTGSDCAVVVKNGSFTWSEDNEDSFTLKDINIEIKSGQLFSVVGTVGAGKSSLISAILGEMEKLAGSVEIQGSVAFVPQEAWIQNNSLKNNILFGKEFDPCRYEKVIEACALLPDIALLPDGSESEIGDKGVNLSGGQRQRISLARAVYNDADTFILDDPLSAVDSHVGRHIFNRVIGPNGLLKHKTRILVTHGIHWLPEVDNIIVMTNGQISEMGNYSQLVNHNGPFASFMQLYATQKESEEIGEDTAKDLSQHILQRSVSKVSSASYCPVEDLDESFESEMSMKEPYANSPLRQWSQKSAFSRFFRKKNAVNTLPIPMEEVGTKPQNELNNKLIQKESMSTGKVKLNVFLTYIKSIGVRPTVLGLSCFVLFHSFNLFSSIWLSWWTADEALGANSTGSTRFDVAPQDRTTFYLSVYGGLGVVQSLLVLSYAVILSFSLLGGAKRLHSQLVTNILRCPMVFFDTTPLGRIVNRFSKDIDTVDIMLPLFVRQFVGTLFILLTAFVLISYITPTVLIAVLPLAVIYYIIQKYFLPASRQLKRIESVNRSPVYSLFGEAILGVTSIRAYHMQSRFISLFEDLVNDNIRANSCLLIVNRWLGGRIDLISNINLMCCALFAIAYSATHGDMGLSLSYAMSLSFFLGWLLRVRSELEASIVAVERIKEYCNLENEAAWVSDHRPDPSWPQEGNIDFQEFDLRYRPGLELVLKKVTCHIKGGEKVGIVGRTGAGKSSLTVSLFRLIEGAGGSITIDGEPIAHLGLHDLRGRITILPQEPVLFSGSLRSNLDLLEQFTDDELWKALEVVHLKSFVDELSTKLDYECGENGSNLSVGQRQLLCLARSVLKKTKILVLDEATAAVDMETDDLIQKTIRSEFQNTTILTIAHRLNTILDYDKIMVLEHGKVKEFASPEILKKDKNSLFYSLLKDAKLV